MKNNDLLSNLVKSKQDLIKKLDSKEIDQDNYDILIKEINMEIKKINLEQIQKVQNEVNLVKPIEKKVKKKVKKNIGVSETKVRFTNKINKKIDNNIKITSFEFQKIPNKKYFIRKNTIDYKIIDLLKCPTIDNEDKLLKMLRFYYPDSFQSFLIYKINDTINKIKNKTNRKYKHLEFNSDKYLVYETYQVRLI